MRSANSQLIKWYNERKMPLTPVRPASDKFDNSKPVEGLNVVENIVSIQLQVGLDLCS